MAPGRVSDFFRRGGAFLAVGGVAFLVDAGVYNALVFGLDGRGVLNGFPVVAKIIAISLATVVTYVGNRYWTFGTRSLKRRPSRYLVFILLNVIAAGIQLACLAFSRYVLGLDGVISDNIAGTIIGQALATIFRFFTYDRWVFPDDQAASRALAVESG